MSLITPDFGLLFWMALIFAVVFFILAKFGFPIITSMVEKRSERIAEGLRKAEEAEKALEEIEKTRMEAQAATRQEQARILKEASASGEAIVSKAREDAQAQAEKILADARARIELERESAMRELRREVAKVSVAVAEKVVKDRLDSPEAQSAYLDALIDEVQKTQNVS